MTISAEARERRNSAFHRYGNEVPRLCCPTCSDRFFTRVGLDEHVRLGNHNDTNLVVRRAEQWRSPEDSARLLDTGRRVAALNNSRRVRCDVCCMESTPAAIGMHQKATGHSGRTEVSVA